MHASPAQQGVGATFLEVTMIKPSLARLREEQGVVTAEYAVATAAGCGFASILIKLLTSDWGQQLLKTLFQMVLKILGIAF
jgi:hypothetical protein